MAQQSQRIAVLVFQSLVLPRDHRESSLEAAGGGSFFSGTPLAIFLKVCLMNQLETNWDGAKNMQRSAAGSRTWHFNTFSRELGVKGRNS